MDTEINIRTLYRIISATKFFANRLMIIKETTEKFWKNDHRVAENYNLAKIKRENNLVVVGCSQILSTF